MSDEAALLRAICAHPDEDTPRLAFADYLDEHGEADRAAFVRGQVELATLTEDSLHRREVAFRCRQLLDANEDRWLDPREAFQFDYGWSRGFVETFTTTPQDLDYGDAELYRTNPFRRVWLWELEGSIDGVHLLPADNHITALDLIGNNLNVNQLKKLAKVTHLPHLRELGLMFNDLRDSAVKLLCGEPFFQRLELIRLGANPLTARGRDLLRAHFGDRITFAPEREPDRLYTVQDDRVGAGWGADFTQFVSLGTRVAVFDHAGNLLHFEEPEFADFAGHGIRDGFVKWLAERGFRSATARVKAFRFPGGGGLTPFNWWADTYAPRHPQHGELKDAVRGWLEEGQYRFDFGGDDNWFDRTGEVTDT